MHAIRYATMAALLAITAGLTGCASVANMAMTRNERTHALIVGSVMRGGEPAVSVNLLELANVTEAPAWRTLLAAAIDAGCAWGIKELGDSQGWWGDDDDEDKPAEAKPAPGSDAEVRARIKGDDNKVRVEYEYLPGGGKMPNIETTVEGNGNNVTVEARPPAEG